MHYEAADKIRLDPSIHRLDDRPCSIADTTETQRETRKHVVTGSIHPPDLCGREGQRQRLELEECYEVLPQSPTTRLLRLEARESRGVGGIYQECKALGLMGPSGKGSPATWHVKGNLLTGLNGRAAKEWMIAENLAVTHGASTSTTDGLSAATSSGSTRTSALSAYAIPVSQHSLTSHYLTASRRTQLLLQRNQMIRLQPIRPS